MIAYGYREIEHTADWELEVWAPDFAKLLEQAALGMTSLARIQLKEAPRQQHTLSVLGADREAQMVNFLSELLFLSETERIAFDVFEINIKPNSVDVVALGAPIASQEKEIKAVTYHNLKIQETEDGLRVNLVFDV